MGCTGRVGEMKPLKSHMYHWDRERYDAFIARCHAGELIPGKESEEADRQYVLLSLAAIESKLEKIVDYLNKQGIEQLRDESTISRNILGD